MGCTYLLEIVGISVGPAEDLAGLKVRHGLDKVMEGGAVVLTLRDTSILADGDVNDGEYIL
jgi:hypothetical protein